MTVCEDSALEIILKNEQVLNDTRQSLRSLKEKVGPSNEDYFNDHPLIDDRSPSTLSGRQCVRDALREKQDRLENWHQLQELAGIIG